MNFPRFPLTELVRVHDMTEAIQVIDANRYAGAEAPRFTELLKSATAALDEAISIVSRVGRSGDLNARSESAGDVEASLDEPHQASVGSDEPHLPTTTVNGPA